MDELDRSKTEIEGGTGSESDVDPPAPSFMQ